VIAVARFTATRIPFGRAARPAVTADEDDDGRDLPRPHLLRLQARRAAGIQEAAETLALLPGPGESLHAVMTARLDMTDVLNALLEELGRCDLMLVATLGLNRRNYKAMLRWLDTGAVGGLTLLVSKFFRAHNGELFTEMVDSFRERKQRVAAVDSHAKVATLAFADGTRLVAEGSSNLCSNGSAREQFCLINEAGIHDFHAAWISAMAPDQ
jgi:hypothetical protein